MNFLKKIFNTKQTQSSENINLTEKEILQMLGDAICDVGYWSWWTSDLPNIVQIEFGGTQLYFPPKDNSEPPNSQIAIQFINPKSISFLSLSKVGENNSEKWFNLLHEDKMESQVCSYDSFTFVDESEMKRIISHAKITDTILGYPPTEESFFKENFKLTFWAGEFGFAVSSENIKLLTQDGEIKMEEIPSINSNWWKYWREYWDLKKTEKPLPKNYVCEVTIPMKN
ncbi:hypothetical protein [Flavobacterium phycosphaerae]|uniref:hypothetical protein n=1 Tax=Flavobacterium phycosphaerae TaxID=2697515 RepID=UPI00138A1BC0|nr:hypothetical protein [Flavobacterium phycosphaerae]